MCQAWSAQAVTGTDSQRASNHNRSEGRARAWATGTDSQRASNHNCGGARDGLDGTGTDSQRASNHNYTSTNSFDKSTGTDSQRASNHNCRGSLDVCFLLAPILKEHQITTPFEPSIPPPYWHRFSKSIKSQQTLDRIRERRTGTDSQRASNHN